MDVKTNLGGRPPKPPEELRSETVKFMVTPAEKEAIRKAAEYYQDDEISMFIRNLIMDWVMAIESGADVEKSVSAACATAEDKAKTLGVDVEIKPAFKKYKVVVP
jgi:hypothetical protein